MDLPGWTKIREFQYLAGLVVVSVIGLAVYFWDRRISVPIVAIAGSLVFCLVAGVLLWTASSARDKKEQSTMEILSRIYEEFDRAYHYFPFTLGRPIKTEKKFFEVIGKWYFAALFQTEPDKTQIIVYYDMQDRDLLFNLSPDEEEKESLFLRFDPYESKRPATSVSREVHVYHKGGAEKGEVEVE